MSELAPPVLARAPADRRGPDGEAWRVWSMSSLPRVQAGLAVNLARQPAAAASAAPAACDSAELDRLRTQARDAGAAEGRSEGLAKGHAEGYAAGLEAGQAAARVQAAQLRSLAQALPQALRRAEGEIAESVLALALEVARQVVHRSLQADPGLVVRVVQDLLHREPSLQGEPRLLLHPLDLQLVTNTLGTELQSAGWQVRPDESVRRGGCLVHAGSGTHDAALETRWARVAAACGSDHPIGS